MIRFNSIVDHFRVQEVDDGQGGYTEDKIKIAEGIAVRISRNTARQREQGERFRGENDYTVYARTNLDIKRGDELVVADGRTFEILNVLEPSLANRHVEGQAREIETRATEG